MLAQDSPDAGASATGTVVDVTPLTWYDFTSTCRSSTVMLGETMSLSLYQEKERWLHELRYPREAAPKSRGAGARAGRLDRDSRAAGVDTEKKSLTLQTDVHNYTRFEDCRPGDLASTSGRRFGPALTPIPSKGAKEKSKKVNKSTEQPMESGSAAAAVLYARYPQMKDLGVVAREGPPHEPLFTVVVSVKGRQFRGVAASKKAAKHEACRAALRELHPDGYSQPVEPQGPNTGAIPLENGASATEEPLQPEVEAAAFDATAPSSEGAATCAATANGDVNYVSTHQRKPFVGCTSWNPARRLRNQLCDMRCPAEVSQKYQKSALMLLNELFGSDVEWGQFETCGPPNRRTFCIVLKVKVGGGAVREFPGESGKKREAKQVASFTALKELSMEGPDVDIGEQEEANEASLSSGAENDDKKPEDDNATGRLGKPRRTTLRKPRKTPLQQLNEMLPNTNFTLIDDVGTSDGRFTYAVTVRGQTFHGMGASKKEASHRAAAAVLLSIYSINYEEMEQSETQYSAAPGTDGPNATANGTNPVECAETNEENSVPPVTYEATDLHRKVALASSQKYSELNTLIPLTAVGRNIFATIVMHRYDKASEVTHNNGNKDDVDPESGQHNKCCDNCGEKQHGDKCGKEGTLPESFTVVAIGTGTKVIDGNLLSMEGERVHDCHGEVVARRAFMRYLYREVEMCLRAVHATDSSAPKDLESIFEFTPEHKFRLRDGIDFYMYVSSSPCGDGRVFVAADNTATRKQDNHPRRLSRGLLRYKVEIGEGTLPSSERHIQTVDGILGGERLRTMSCSDKMLCWNVLGLQGTLLTHFIQPVFMKAVVVGNLYSHEHMRRAVITRSEDVDLPDVYAEHLLHPPDLTHVPFNAALERRDTARAATNCFDWSIGDETLEILQGSYGQRLGEHGARICKRNLFKRFMGLCVDLEAFTGYNPIKELGENPTYRQVKNLATVHCTAKKALIDHLETYNGYWMKKPVEVSSFTLVDIE